MPMSTVLTDQLVLSDEAQDLLFRQARTANAFTDEPVTDEQVEAIYDLVKWGPTALNGQPLRMLIVRSDEAKARLLPHLSDGNVAKTASAPLVAVLAYDADFHEHLPRVFPHMPQAKSWFEGDEKAASRAESARENAWLQAGYFLLGVRAAGLAAGPMGGFDRDGVDAEFFGDRSWRSFLVVNIGRPAAEGAWFDRSPRLDLDDVIETV